MADNPNVNRLYKGIVTDSSPIDQPKDTSRFTLNGLLKSREGDRKFLSNEEANEIFHNLPSGYAIVGNEYMSKGSFCLFLTDEAGNSIIGIATPQGNFEIHVDDSTQTEKLDFRLDKPIDATYRLRRGCERVVYFTDDYNEIRYFNFDKAEDFQDNTGDWNPSKFKLFRNTSKIPEYDEIEVIRGGNVLPGSVNFDIQYLDEDFNPTHFLSSSDTVIVYNDDSLSKPFPDVKGSSTQKTDYREYGPTNKAIRVKFSNLDTDFAFYRVAIIESNNGSGEVSSVRLSQPISTEIDTFVYNGNNAEEASTIEEIRKPPSVIERAKNIEQLENKLILSNLQGSQVNFCRLQRYVSKIKVNLVKKSIVLNSTQVPDNPKRQELHNEDIGYMPGEIYAFGGVYVFEDGTHSPVYHIPGKNPTYFSEMSDENECENLVYGTSNDCNGELDYWGYDSQGEPLAGKPVRHHRFPYRSQVNSKLFEEAGTESTITVNTFLLDITGEVDAGYTDPEIEYRISYTADGNPKTYEGTIVVSDYQANEEILGILLDKGSETFVLTGVEEKDPNTELWGPIISGLSYTTRTESEEVEFQDKAYTTEIFGIELEDVEAPPLEATNGKKVVGFYLVRLPREDADKTVLDSGIMGPCIHRGNFVSHSHLFTDQNGATSQLKEDILYLIHPEHKFRDRQLQQTTSIVIEGQFESSIPKGFKEATFQDVQPGTSYNPDKDKKREKDSDGFDLHLAVRSNPLSYNTLPTRIIPADDIKEIFYLDSLFGKTVEDINSNNVEVYNASMDNKVGFVQLNTSEDRNELLNKAYFVRLIRKIADPYPNYRTSTYYKEHNNYIPLTEGQLTTFQVFNGDVYVSPSRYCSSIFYDVRLRERSSKSGVLNFIVGALATIAGTALVATGAGVGAGLALIGLGVSQVSAGFKKEQLGKVTTEVYDSGLRTALRDPDLIGAFDSNPPDDEMQWFIDTANSFWFESAVNLNWRLGATVGITDFLGAPEAFKAEELIRYAADKLTVLDSENAGRNYLGFSKAEIYDDNLDYYRRNREKLFFPLGIEFDCCSDCYEDFPHRVAYSLESFQEELSDNYRVFRALDYRDIEGETGEIMNMFKIQDNLYLHTEEAIWHLPKNQQERITGDLVSFIGTGSFFSIPPKKIVDDENGMSAGTRHKWGFIKTPIGVFFVCEPQGIVYHFSGNQLKNISRLGNHFWFKENIPIKTDRNYLLANNEEYPYRDNPHSEIGTGFVLGYDSKYERVLVSKKDKLFTELVSDYRLCSSGGQTVIFNNFSQTIQSEATDGWEFVGIENCELQFRKIVGTQIEVEETEVFPPTADIFIQLDMSSSFSNTNRTEIRTAAKNWVAGFRQEYPNWTGNLYFQEHANEFRSERWLRTLQFIEDNIDIFDENGVPVTGYNTNGKDIIVMSFVNENADNPLSNNDEAYHVRLQNSGPEFMSDPIDAPLGFWAGDRTDFIARYNALVTSGGSFRGLIYPIVYSHENQDYSNPFLQHAIAALKGVPFTAQEAAEIAQDINPFVPDWDFFIDSIQNTNPYDDDGLENYGWQGKWNRGWDGNGAVITTEQFSTDINEFLKESIITTQVEKTIDIYDTKSIPGDPLTDLPVNDSWTMSFDLEENVWVSWHSYLPSLYITAPERLYSWVYGIDSIYKHNKQNQYQTYYGNYAPFIVEYVSIGSPLQTTIYDYVNFLTEAREFSPAVGDFIDKRLVTFNKFLAYNSEQCTGELSLLPKDASGSNYLFDQVNSPNTGEISVDRNERNWSINDFRDTRVDYNVPIFDKTLEQRQVAYYIDKVLNQSSIDFEKPWPEQQPMRDKYLIIRLTFDIFDNTKLVFNYSIEPQTNSPR